MKLNNITVGMWRDISNYLNYNFNKLSIVTSKLEYSICTVENLAFKGVFDSQSLLYTKYPSPEYGEYAFVLVEEGEGGEERTLFTVYLANKSGEWEELNGVYDPEVILSNYLEMVKLSSISDIDQDIEDYLNDR